MCETGRNRSRPVIYGESTAIRRDLVGGMHSFGFISSSPISPSHPRPTRYRTAAGCQLLGWRDSQGTDAFHKGVRTRHQSEKNKKKKKKKKGAQEPPKVDTGCVAPVLDSS